MNYERTAGLNVASSLVYKAECKDWLFDPQRRELSRSPRTEFSQRVLYLFTFLPVYLQMKGLDVFGRGRCDDDKSP
jgi:hypothetical protein